MLTRAWIVACVIAALFVLDRIERRVYRPLCLDACARAGETLLDVSTGSASRGGLFDNSIHCVCAGGPRVTLYIPWGAYFGWFGAFFGVVVLLGGLVAVARWLWRRS